MSLVPTVNISYQEPVVEEPEDYPQAPRLIGPNSEKFRIPRLPISPTAGEKKKGEKNPRGGRLIKKIRARQARALERKAKRAEEKKKKKKSTGRYCRLCDTWANSAASWKDHIQSRGHKAKKERIHNPPPDCEECGVGFPSWVQRESHLKGSKHLKVVARLYNARLEQ